MFVMFLNHEGPAFFGVNYLNIKLLNAPYQETIQKIETASKNFAPGIPFEYSLLSEQNKTLYLKEENQTTINDFNPIGTFYTQLGFTDQPFFQLR